MAWSRVQTASAVQTTGATIAKAFTTANLTAGSKLIAAVTCNHTGAQPTTSGVSDGTNAFTKVATIQGNDGGGNFMETSLWVLDTVTAGIKPTITATMTNTTSTAGSSICIQEVSGLATGTSASLDGTASTKTEFVGGPTGNAPAYTSTAASEYLLQIYSDWGSGTNPSVAGYTGPDGTASSSDAIVLLTYKNSTGGAEGTPGWAPTAAGNLVAYIAVAFKLAGTGFTGTGTGAITFGGSGTLPPTAARDARQSARVALGGAAAGTDIDRIARMSVRVAISAVVSFSGTGTGAITFGGSGTATSVVSAGGTGAITFGGSGTATSIVSTTGTGAISFGGAGTASFSGTFVASGTGAITFAGSGTVSSGATAVRTGVTMFRR